MFYRLHLPLLPLSFPSPKFYFSLLLLSKAPHLCF